MSGGLAYALGVFTVPLAAAMVVAYVCAAETGKEIECRVCGYSTGSMGDTRRITCWVRFRWHKLTTGHHTRRWVRQQEWAKAERAWIAPRKGGYSAIGPEPDPRPEPPPGPGAGTPVRQR